MDSNRKYIDRYKLWHTNETTYQNERFENPEAISIHQGVYDENYKSRVQVFNEIEQLTGLIRSKYPQVRIVIFQITPRTDNRDIESITCNRLLANLCDLQIIIVK